MTRLTPADIHRIAKHLYDLGDVAECNELRAHAAYLDTLEWQPIETAPKDGMEILGYGLKLGPPGYYIQVFPFYRDRWTIEWMDGHGTPTHWMPLPKPPEAR